MGTLTQLRLLQDSEMIRRNPCRSWLTPPQPMPKFVPSRRRSVLMLVQSFSTLSFTRACFPQGTKASARSKSACATPWGGQPRQERLLDTNPNAFRDMVTTFLEANGRGYWETSEENIERLQELYAEVEDRIEGV